MTVRPLVDGDIDEAIEAWYRASLVAHPFLSDEFLAAEAERLRHEWLPAGGTLVYETEGRVVGFLSLAGNEVGGFFVHPDHQGRGFGRALMDEAASTRPFLELDVFEDNAIGRRFYAAYGFEQIGHHVNDEVGLTELRLRRGAGGPPSGVPDGNSSAETFRE